MSFRSRRAFVVFLALLGIVFAVAVTWATSQIVSQRIGLSSEPVGAGLRLLPARRPTSEPPRTSTTPSRPATTAPAQPAPTVTSAPTRPVEPEPVQPEPKRSEGGGDGEGQARSRDD